MMSFGLREPYVRLPLAQLIMDCRVKPGNDNIEALLFCMLEELSMATPPPIEYAEASAAVRAVYDDIKKTRNVPDVNNFWKYLARDPVTLRRTWESVKEVMAPGTLDPLTKEMVYLAVSVTNGCGYCIASHTAAARKAGMSEAMFGELMAVTGMANETNRLANGYRVPIDPAFQT
jgi:AhpD family alkylhydroperoxidase